MTLTATLLASQFLAISVLVNRAIDAAAILRIEMQVKIIDLVQGAFDSSNCVVTKKSSVVRLTGR